MASFEKPGTMALFLRWRISGDRVFSRVSLTNRVAAKYLGFISSAWLLLLSDIILATICFFATPEKLVGSLNPDGFRGEADISFDRFVVVLSFASAFSEVSRFATMCFTPFRVDGSGVCDITVDVLRL